MHHEISIKIQMLGLDILKRTYTNNSWKDQINMSYATSPFTSIPGGSFSAHHTRIHTRLLHILGSFQNITLTTFSILILVA